MSDGVMYLAVGSSRSGKTAWVKQQVKKATRLLVWDVEGQYSDLGNMSIVRTLPELMKRLKKGGQRISYQPSKLSDFNLWGEFGFLWAKQGALEGQHSVIVAEELADVTSPAKAPDGWGMLLRRGLKYDCDIYGITQRPAESDKTILGNCTVIHCCGLVRANDQKYMAQNMNVPLADIANMNRAQLEYIHKNMATNDTKKGRLSF